MMAATKQGLLKKKRTTRIRHPIHDPDPTAPPPPPPAVDARRSLRPRRRRPLAGDYFDDDYEVDGDDIASEEEADEERRRLKPVLKLPTAPCRRVSPSSDGEDDDSEMVKLLKKRRVEACSDDSDGSGHPREERKRSIVVRGTLPGTRLPKKAVLFEVLERLQKKDTYSVFARPVDPEELPDYHDIIEHPMDFGTVRRKVAGGLYPSLEQFEDDVFLICSNAMQYNAPDTVYFRQAHSIQDLARKKFQELRADAISSGAARKTEEKTIFHTEEKKTPKKPQCRNAYEQLPSDISSMEKIIKKPHCRTAPDQHRSDFSSMEKKIIKKPQYRAPPKPTGSDFSSLEKKIIKDFSGKHAVKPLGSGTSSMEKSTLKEGFRKTERELPLPDIAILENKMLKKTQSRIARQTLDSDIQSENKTSKKVQCKTETSDIPLENKTSKKAQCRTETEPPDSDTSSLEKKTSKTAPCRTAPEPLGPDASSGPTLTSAADTCTHMSRLQAQGIVSPAEACTGLSTAQGNDLPSTTETHIGLSSLQTDAFERSVAINGSVDGSSSLGESKSEKADEVPVKSSPSKLGMNLFVVDVNRRETYNPSDQEQVVEPDSVFDVFEGEPRELVAVEPQSKYSYARSLSKFAASLGPIAWEIVSKKIEQALHPGVNFGPGWVGEYEPLPTPVIYVGNKTHQHQLQKQQHNQQQLHNQQELHIQPQLHNEQELHIQQLHNQQKLHNQQQQQRQLQQPQTVLAKDKRNETKSKTAPIDYHNMPFCLQSQATTVKPHNRTSNGVERTNRERTQDQKQGLFGIDLACQPAISSPMPQLQKQATGVFSNVHTHEIAAHRPQSSYEAAKSMFLPISPRERNQVQSEPQQQPQSVTPQRRNDAVSMNASGLNATWRSSDASRPNTSSGIISNQQAGVQYWFARGSQEQATSDPLRWMSSSGKNTDQSNMAKVCTNNIERSMPNSVHSVRQENPNTTAAQAWMSIGAPAEWKPVDGGGVRNKQVGSATFNSTWKPPAPSRVHDDSKVPQEPVQGVSEASQVQNKGLVIFPQLMTTDLSRLRSPWQGMVQHSKQKDQLPPDLNISFQPPGSPARPSSGIHIDSQQPDLALQL